MICSYPLAFGALCRNVVIPFGVGKLEWWATRWRNNFEDISYNRLDTIPGCDRQMDRRHTPRYASLAKKTAAGETTDRIRIKKVRGCKNGTGLLYHHAKYGGDRGSRAGCRRKSDVLCLSRFGITKFVITETL